MINHIFIKPLPIHMTEWFKQSLILYSTPESRAAGKLSVLAIIEVIASVAIYWWIAAAWETQLHILVSLIAAPLYLLRSDESVTKAQVMWDEYNNDGDTTTKYSFKFWCLLLFAGFITGLISYFLSIHLLAIYQGWSLAWRSAFLGWFLFNISVAATIMIKEMGVLARAGSALAVSTAVVTIMATIAGVIAGAGLSKGTLVVTVVIVIVIAGKRAQAGLGIFFGTGTATGTWLRTLLIRIISISTFFISGVKSAPMNWQRSLWVEDFLLAPELIPGVEIKPIYTFEHQLWGLKSPSSLKGFIICLVLLPIFFLPTLVWRLSLKSTAWFYAPIFLMSKPGNLAEADNRLRFFTRGPTLWEFWKLCFAVIGLTVAVISLIDVFAAFEFWRGFSNEAPLSPLGWLLIMDWERFFNQPWQWFSLPAAFLTVVLYLWVNQIRVHRKADIELGQDPELHNSAENHPGITIYWLDRLRNVLVVVSLVIGLWYFVKWAYLEDKLTLLNPWLSSIFGPLPS